MTKLKKNIKNEKEREREKERKRKREKEREKKTEREKERLDLCSKVSLQFRPHFRFKSYLFIFIC